MFLSTFVHPLVYKDISEAVKKHPEVDVLVNFASLRSAYDATIEALNLNHVRSHQLIHTFVCCTVLQNLHIVLYEIHVCVHFPCLYICISFPNT